MCSQRFRSVPKPLAPGPLICVLFVWLADRNAGWCCAAMGAFSSVVLLGLQISAGNRSAQPYVSGPLRVQGGQQQRHRPQPIFVGGANDAILFNDILQTDACAMQASFDRRRIYALSMELPLDGTPWRCQRRRCQRQLAHAVELGTIR